MKDEKPLYRELLNDETIEDGDEFLMPGTLNEWRSCYDSVGRTVAQQLARNTNAATTFRRRVSDHRSLEEIDLEIQRLKSVRRLKMVEVAAATAPCTNAERRELITLAKVLNEHNVDMPTNRLQLQSKWRALVPPLVGGIHGLPTMTGRIIATDGVLGIMIREDGHYADVHVENFIASDGQLTDQLDKIKSTNKRAKPTHEQLIADLCNIC